MKYLIFLPLVLQDHRRSLGSNDRLLASPGKEVYILTADCLYSKVKIKDQFYYPYKTKIGYDYKVQNLANTVYRLLF